VRTAPDRLDVSFLDHAAQRSADMPSGAGVRA
jgi:hypothetical protein